MLFAPLFLATTSLRGLQHRAQERFSNIDFTADINVIGIQGDHYVVKLPAFIQNKGKALHKMQKFEFDLNVLYTGDVRGSLSSSAISNMWAAMTTGTLPKGLFSCLQTEMTETLLRHQ